MKKIIHNADSGENRYVRFILPYYFKELMEKIPSTEYISGDIEKIKAIEKDTISAIYNSQKITLEYYYSPGLGNFPREIEQITLYGDNEDINNMTKLLEEILKGMNKSLIGNKKS